MSAMTVSVNPSQVRKYTLSPGDVLVDELDGTKFQVHEFIGSGGMGEVYRGVRLDDGTRCAIKCVRHDLVQNSTVLLRSRFEAKAFRKISHPNVVRVFGTGIRWDNVPWMCMEWLDGLTIAEVIEKKGRIPLRWALEIVRDLCRGLRAIHEHAIHRDIKPSNVHLGFDGVTRVLDLGIAKSKESNVHLTSTGFQVGTLPFMSPEQLDNTGPIDHRADLWSAVVVLYILMTGEHPFDFERSMSKIRLGYSILSEPHRPLLSVLPSAPPFFGQIIDRGLAKEPEHRHRSAEELAEVLNAGMKFLETQTGHAEPLSSLAADLRGQVALVVAMPAHLPPMRTTEPMPPPKSGVQAHVPSPVSVSPVVSVQVVMGGLSPTAEHEPNADDRGTLLPPTVPAAFSPVNDGRSEDVNGRQSVVRVKRPRSTSTDEARPAVGAPEEIGETGDTPMIQAPKALVPVAHDSLVLPALEEDLPAEEPASQERAPRTPRWILALLLSSALLTTAEGIYFYWTRYRVVAPSGPIVVPAMSVQDPTPTVSEASGEVDDGGSVLSTTASATSTVTSTPSAVAIPSAPPQPATRPHVRGPARQTSPTIDPQPMPTARHRVFGADD